MREFATDIFKARRNPGGHFFHRRPYEQALSPHAGGVLW